MLRVKNIILSQSGKYIRPKHSIIPDLNHDPPLQILLPNNIDFISNTYFNDISKDQHTKWLNFFKRIGIKDHNSLFTKLPLYLTESNTVQLINYISLYVYEQKIVRRSFSSKRINEY